MERKDDLSTRWFKQRYKFNCQIRYLVYDLDSIMKLPKLVYIELR